MDQTRWPQTEIYRERMVTERGRAWKEASGQLRAALSDFSSWGGFSRIYRHLETTNDRARLDERRGQGRDPTARVASAPGIAHF
jgi:hypothetical protein